jgi:hypothetical protein
MLKFLLWRILLFLVPVLLAVQLPARAQLIPRGSEFQVNEWTTGSQVHQQVAMNASGRFVIVWVGYHPGGSSSDVIGHLYDSDGVSLTGEFQVNALTTSVQMHPDVAMDPNGNFVVVWMDAWSQGIRGRRFDDVGVPLGSEFQVDTYLTGTKRYPRVDVQASGGFIVVWTDRYQDGSEWGVMARRFDSSGAPLGAEFVVNTYTTNDQRLQDVAAADDGSFVVVWSGYRENDQGFGISGRRFDSTGTALGADFHVNVYTTGLQFLPRVEMNGSGEFVVVWEDTAQDAGGDGVMARQFNAAGEPLSGEIIVPAHTHLDQEEPAVALEESGRFAVTWIGDGFGDSDGDDEAILARAVGSSGFAASGEFVVNSYSTNHQVNPSIAGDGNGRFVVTWGSWGQDGHRLGVFAQRFEIDLFEITQPMDGATLDCRDPKLMRPTFTWNPGVWDKFRVVMSAGPEFLKRDRVTSGDSWFKATTWTPRKKKWRRLCRKVLNANPFTGMVYVRVRGKDVDVQRKKDPARKTWSDVVRADALFM